MTHTYLIHLCIHCKECPSNVNLNLFRRNLQKLSDVYMNMKNTFQNILYYYYNIQVWYSIINPLINTLITVTCTSQNSQTNARNI